MKIILACEESGAKGCADQDEQFAGQVGVFAGLFVPEEVLSITEQRFERAIAPYRGSDGKLHITDLPSQQQGSMRADIFDPTALLLEDICWFVSSSSIRVTLAIQEREGMRE